jgi:hypothetical protein
MNGILEKFCERNIAELKLAFDEVEWWNDLVARGQVKPQHARGHIEAAKNIIATKRYILNLVPSDDELGDASVLAP